MTPHTRAFTAFFPLFVLTLNACFFAPQEVVRFRAERAGSTWSNGLELHAANTRQLEVRSGFLGYSHDKIHGYSGPYPLFFLISATNQSDSSVLIDPLDFRISVPGQGKDSNLAAIDPEAALHKARQDMAAEVASHASYEGTTLAIDAVGAVLGLAHLFSTPEERSDWVKSRERDRETQEDIRRRHREKMAEFSARERLWSDSAMRKTTLAPGGLLRGRIGFAIESYAAIPDTARLEYRERTGGFSELVTYGRVREKPAAPAAAKATGTKAGGTYSPASGY